MELMMAVIVICLSLFYYVSGIPPVAQTRVSERMCTAVLELLSLFDSNH